LVSYEGYPVKTRIVERTGVDGKVSYVIQQRHFLFRWFWVDAWINCSCGADCKDYFASLIEAEESLCYFDGSVPVNKVVG